MNKLTVPPGKTSLPSHADWAGEIRASDQADAITLLDKAGEALDLARRELADEHLTAAARAARIAESLLERAVIQAELR
jgi:hypothetical protein